MFFLNYSPVFSESNITKRLLVIQSDSGHIYGDLIACARYRIDDEREKFFRLKEKSKELGITHVLLIIHLPRHVRKNTKTVSFVGFQGGSWTSSHIDDIHMTSESGITLNDAMSASISQLFYNKNFIPPKEIDPPSVVESYMLLQHAVEEEEMHHDEDKNGNAENGPGQSEEVAETKDVDAQVDEPEKEHDKKETPSQTDMDNEIVDQHSSEQLDNIEEQEHDMTLDIEDVHLQENDNTTEEEAIVLATSSSEENSDKEEVSDQKYISSEENVTDQQEDADIVSIDSSEKDVDNDSIEDGEEYVVNKETDHESMLEDSDNDKEDDNDIVSKYEDTTKQDTLFDKTTQPLEEEIQSNNVEQDLHDDIEVEDLEQLQETDEEIAIAEGNELKQESSTSILEESSQCRQV